MIMLAKRPDDDALSSEESKEFIAHEQNISQHKHAFVKCGLSLSAIQTKRLYRGEYKTFEQYCSKKWGFSRGRAYQLMDAAETVTLIEKVSTTGIHSERAARELSRIPSEQRKEVLEAVAESGKVTAKAIRAEIAKRNPKPAPVQSIKPLRVIEVSSESVFVERVEGGMMVDTGAIPMLTAELRRLADDMEEDYAMPKPGEEFDGEKYGERLMDLGRRLLKLKEVA